MVRPRVQNTYVFLSKHTVTHMDRLMRPKEGKATCTMVVNFTTKAGANAALAAECIAWEDQPKRAIQYSGACKVL